MLSNNQDSDSRAGTTSPEKYFTIDGLLRAHASEHNDYPLVGYPVERADDFHVHTAKDLDRYAESAAAKYTSLGLDPADSTQAVAPVAAVLARGGLDVIVTIFSLNRLGWTVLFLSTRLATPAYVQLLQKAGCSTILSTKAFANTIKEIQAETPIKSLPIVGDEDYIHIISPRFHRKYDPLQESLKTAWIIHSSGSTGYPKPIFVSNIACLNNAQKNYPWRTFCTSPLFHSHGLMGLLRCVYAKKPIYFGNFAIPVTRQNLIEAMRVARPEIVLAVPYILKLLAESDEGIEELTKARLVLYAGSSCPEDIGDRLVARGVELATNYGSTETGYLMNSLRPSGDADWNFLRLQSPTLEHVLMDEVAPGLFECVALESLPSRAATNSDDPPNSFRTRDLFIRHPEPSKSNLWKFVSRMDDRVTLINGEKVLPVPIEGRIRQSSLVKEATVFGINREMPGLLVFRSDAASTLTDDQYLEAIWPVVEAANTGAETFSQISKDLVVILPENTTYPTTPKGTIVRQQMYEIFSTSIEEAYDRFENGQTGGLRLGITELEQFILEKFRNELQVNLDSADADIFAAGVDSLQTIKMWAIMKRELDLGARQNDLRRNVVFEKGNVRTLARYLHYLRTSEGGREKTELENMEDLIARYSSFEPHKARQTSPPTSDTVLITGATGSLGSFLLAETIKRTHVSNVWALVRGSDAPSARSRVLESLASRHLNLSECKLSKLTVIPADFGQPKLGLSREEFDALATSVTHVIHCAWAVNFNIPVSLFEAQHIRGVHNLINLCLQSPHPSPARFLFCSSLSVAGGTPRPAHIPEKVVADLNHAQDMGYARSKLVAEHIVRNTMRSTGINARVLRIGQIVGDGLSGTWNDSEAVPLMIRSAITLGALPTLDESHSWLPVDVCASAILDIAFPLQGNVDAKPDPDLVYHILNPQRFHWTRDLLPALRCTRLPSFKDVCPQEWVKMLKESSLDPVQNPSIKLLEFWDTKYGDRTGSNLRSHEEGGTDVVNGHSSTGADLMEETAGNDQVFDMDRTMADCPSLRTVPNLISERYIDKFVDAWLRKWNS